MRSNPRRPSRYLAKKRDEELKGVLTGAEASSTLTGVTITWLCHVFGLSRPTVGKRLLGLKPVSTDKHGGAVYNAMEAISRVVTPSIDLKDYIQALNPKDLPEALREAYWSAKLKQQRYEERAGILWRSEKVLALMGEVLQRQREQLQILPDALERELSLPPEKFDKVKAIVEEMQDEMYQSLLKLANESRTPNQLGESDDDDSEDGSEDYEPSQSSMDRDTSDII